MTVAVAVAWTSMPTSAQAPVDADRPSSRPSTEPRAPQLVLRALEEHLGAFVR